MSKKKVTDIKTDIKTEDAKNSSESFAGDELKKELAEIKNELAEVKTIVKSFKTELKGLVEIQQRLVHERLGVSVPPPPKEYGEEPTSKTAPKIHITSIDSDRIRIAGNTFDFRTAIKDAGTAKWEGGTKSWSLPSDCLDKLIKNLEDVNLVRGTDFSVNESKNVKNDDAKNSVKSGTKSGFKKQMDSEEDGGFGSGFD